MKKIIVLISLVQIAQGMDLADEVRPVYKKTYLSDDADPSIDTLFSFNPDLSDGWLDVFCAGDVEIEKFKEKRERKEKLKTCLISFIDQGKDLDIPLEECDGETILTAAAVHKSFTCVIEHALKKGATPNKGNDVSWRPLWIALRERCLENARVLIAGGAQTKGMGYLHFICSPLRDLPHYNATYLRVNLLRMLLQAGVNPDETDENQETALFGLLWKFRANTWANVRQLDEDNYESFLFERKKLITILLDAKLNHDLKNKHGLSAVEAINDPRMMDLKEDALVTFLKDEITTRSIQP